MNLPGPGGWPCCRRTYRARPVVLGMTQCAVLIVDEVKGYFILRPYSCPITCSDGVIQPWA